MFLWLQVAGCAKQRNHQQEEESWSGSQCELSSKQDEIVSAKHHSTLRSIGLIGKTTKQHGQFMANAFKVTHLRFYILTGVL